MSATFARSRNAIAIALTTLIGAPACAPQDVVVATLAAPDASSAPPDGGDAPDAGPPPPGQPCRGNGDCPPNAFCAKSSCNAPTGGCQPRPLQCPDDGTQVCGCDQVAYWNDCLRKQAGAPFSTAGDCSVGAPCFDPSAQDCPVPGASCARLVREGEPCPFDLQGYCWVLPDQCPVPTGGPLPHAYVECGPSGGGPGSGGACRALCDAIRAGVPQHEQHLGCP